MTGGAGFIGSHVVDELRRARPRRPGGRRPAARRAPRRAGYLDPAPSGSRATSATPDTVERASTASTPSATRRRRSGSASTSATSPTTSATTTSAPPSLLGRWPRARLHGPDRARLEHGRVRRGRATRAPTTASCGPRPRTRRPTSSGPLRAALPGVRRAADPRPRRSPEDAPLDPRNVYAATKLHQEHLCAAFAARRGVAGRPRCATTTSTAHGCPATRPTPASPASSAAARARARPRACSRTAASAATSSTSATSPTPTSLALTPDAPVRFNVASGSPTPCSTWPARWPRPRAARIRS